MQGNLPLKISISTTRTTRSGRTTSAYLVLTFHTSRKSSQTCDNNSKRKPEDKNGDLDVNTLIWGMLIIVTQQAAVHLGGDYLDPSHSTKNQPPRTVKQLFDETSKLVREHTEIQGISLIDWQENS